MACQSSHSIFPVNVWIPSLQNSFAKVGWFEVDMSANEQFCIYEKNEYIKFYFVYARTNLFIECVDSPRAMGGNPSIPGSLKIEAIKNYVWDKRTQQT